MGTRAHALTMQAQLLRLKEWWRVEEVMGVGGRIVLNPNAPARLMLSYLIHFFDFAPFFRPRTGTGFFPPLLFPCRGGDEEEEDASALVTWSPAWGWSWPASRSPWGWPP